MGTEVVDVCPLFLLVSLPGDLLALLGSLLLHEYVSVNSFGPGKALNRIFQITNTLIPRSCLIRVYFNFQCVTQDETLRFKPVLKSVIYMIIESF